MSCRTVEITEIKHTGVHAIECVGMIQVCYKQKRTTDGELGKETIVLLQRIN